MKLLNKIGALVGLTAFVLAWIWFGWKLSLVIFLAILGNNWQLHRD